MITDHHYRDLLARALSWSDAHVSFDEAVAGLEASLRGVRHDLASRIW